MSIGENIHNYYENMVNDELNRRFTESDEDIDHLADIACVALNNLPPRYFRHEIDMAFYLSPQEFNEMKEKVAKAVDKAVETVDRRLDNADEIVGKSSAPMPPLRVSEPY
ncbi:MAG TPA: late competence development ComFB family protein [Motiliproteus sp.]